MKSISLLHPFVALSLSLLFLAGCKKDDSTLQGDPPTLTVSATVLNGSSLSDNGTVAATDTVDFSIDVLAPAGFNSILIGGSGNSVLDKSDAGAADLAMQVDDVPFRVLTKSTDGGAPASFIFVARDEIDQQSDTVRFSFNIISIADLHLNITLGGFENISFGSFYNAIQNSVSTLLSATSNSSEIDFLSYHTNATGHVIASPDDSDADIVLVSQTSGDLDDFSVRNSTRFRMFTNDPDFGAVRTIPDLENAYSSNVQSSGLRSVSNLSNNDIIGFQTTTSRGARVGLIQIIETAGTAGNNRFIRVNVKIERE